MNRSLIALAAFGLFAVGCEGTDPTTPMADGLDVTPQASVGPVVHRVSVGGPDACIKPGCNGNFSLVAVEYADGSVTGQWQDAFGNGYSYHVAVDCLEIDGNEAWVSGVISNAPNLPSWFVGLDAIIQVADNGVSANDPVDQITYVFFDWGWPPVPSSFNCEDKPDIPWGLFNMPNGQVTIR